MRDLLLSEWRRFRRLTLIAALCHAVLLLFLSRVTDPLQLAYEDHAAMLLVYLLFGIALSLVQVGSYRKPSQWLWLMHRPLSSRRIFAALGLSALAVITVSILLPLLLFVLATDWFTNQVVDTRHYLALVHVLAFTMMAWLAGAHACVSRHKAAILVLLAPLLLALHLASGWVLLIPVLACLVWLACITERSFRADRDAPIRSHGVLILSALPLQLVFFVLLFHLSKVGLELFELARASQRTKVVLETGPEADQFTRSFGQDFMIKGLVDSKDARVASWREQLPLLEIATVIPDIERFPVRHQISNLGALWWDDKRNIEWSFSHDHMRYHGRDTQTGADRGWWGAAGASSEQVFEQPPSLDMTRDVLYLIDQEAQRQYDIVHLQAGESFIGRPSPAFGRTFILTTRRLLVFRPDREADSGFAPPLLDWQLPLPASEAPVAQVHVAELMDGWLVSFFNDAGHEFNGFEQLGDRSQQVLFVETDGKATVVGERHGIRDHHASFGGLPMVPVTSWWLSPVLHVIARSPDLLLDRGFVRRAPLQLLPDVPSFRVIAPVLLLLSVVFAAWWLRRGEVSAGRRAIWLASCLVLGVPAVLSMYCLERRQPQH